MIELPVLIENIIEIVNVAIEMMLVFLYFSLLSKAKVNKAVLYLSYLLSTVILSATVLLTDNILVYLITTIILISSMSFICYDDSIRHKIFWNILFLLIISISEPIVIGLLCIANMGTPDEFLESGLGRYLGMVGTNIIYLWLIGLMHRIINKKIRELPIKYWILIIVIPIISIFLLQTMLDGFVGSNTYSYVSLGVSLAGIIFINLAMFNFFESFEDTLWDYVTQPGRSNGDSAVSITWNKDTFTSGETREFVTYYGLSELEQNLIPPLALSVYADNKVSISNFNYDDINANVYLDNIGDGDATDVSIKITADNLEPKYGTSLTHNYSVIKPSKSYSIPLKFIVPTDSKHNSDINAKLDFELSYKVAKTGDTEVKRITKNITIPKLKRAVVVVPGIMGIDLAKTSNDESVWGSWIEQPSNFDDVKKIHNAFQSLKCDYYGNSNIELYPVNNYGYKRCPALK